MLYNQNFLNHNIIMTKQIEKKIADLEAQLQALKKQLANDTLSRKQKESKKTKKTGQKPSGVAKVKRALPPKKKKKKKSTKSAKPLPSRAGRKMPPPRKGKKAKSPRKKKAKSPKKKHPALREKKPEIVEYRTFVLQDGQYKLIGTRKPKGNYIEMKKFTFRGDKYKATIINQSMLFNYVYGRRGFSHERKGTSITKEWYLYMAELHDKGIPFTKKKFFGDVEVIKNGEKRRVNLSTFDLPALSVPAETSEAKDSPWTKKDETYYLISELIKRSNLNVGDSADNLGSFDILLDGDIRFSSYDVNKGKPLKEVKLRRMMLMYRNLEQLNGVQLYRDGLDNHPRFQNLTEDEKKQYREALENQKAKGEDFESELGKALLKKLEMMNANNNECVPRYLFEELAGRPGYTSLTYDKVKQDFIDVTGHDVKDGYSTQELFDVLEARYPYLSAYAIDPFSNVFHQKKREKRSTSQVVLCFMVNNGHLYPILNSVTKKFVSDNKRLDLAIASMEMRVQFDDDNYTVVDEDNLHEFVMGELEGKVFILDTDNAQEIENVLHVVIKETKYIPHGYKWNGEFQMTAFVHPVTGQVLLDGPDLDMRRSICESLFKEYPNDHFVFRNQSFASIAKDLCTTMVGAWKKSNYNQVTNNVLNSFAPSPIVQTLRVMDDEDIANLRGVDRTKFYSYVLAHNKANIPIYCIHDKIQPYDGQDLVIGEYYVEDIVLPHGFKLKSAFYSYSLVNQLLEWGYIDVYQIKYFIKATHYLPADTFHDFVKVCYNKFGPYAGKKMVNHFIGWLNTQNSTVSNGCLTDDESTVIALYQRAEQHNKKKGIRFVNGVYVYRELEREQLAKTNCSIWRHVISNSIMEMVTTLQQFTTQKVIGVSTDCVFYCGDKLQTEDPVDPEEFKFKHIGGLHEEDSTKMPKMYVEFEDKKFNADDFKVESGSGVMFTGAGGCGKSYTCADMMKERMDKDENILFMAKTNVAVHNIKRIFMKRFGMDESEVPAFTLDSKLMSEKGMKKLIEEFSGVTTVFLDEFSMVEDRLMTTLYHLYTKLKFQVFMFGDMNQLAGVEKEGDDDAVENEEDRNKLMSHFYPDSIAVREMCPELKVLEYREDSSRYTKELYDILKVLLETGKLDYNFKEIDEDLMVNVVKSNPQRKKILKRLLAEKDGYEVEFIYQKAREKYKIFEGMEMVCSANLKKFNLFNNHAYTISEIAEADESLFVQLHNDFNEVRLGLENFRRHFIPIYATTVYKYQGATINEHYNIWEAHKMNKNELYTALSRASSHEFIHCSNLREDEYKSQEFVNDSICLRTKPFHHAVYSKGKIYEIKVGDMYYVGQTTREDYETRIEEHKKYSALKKKQLPVDQYIHDHPELEVEHRLLCYHPCNSLSELTYCETRFIRAYVDEYGEDRILNMRQTDKDKKKKNVLKNQMEAGAEIQVVRNFKKDKFEVKTYGNKKVARMNVNGKNIKTSVSFVENPTADYHRSEEEAEQLCLEEMRQKLAKVFD